MRKALMIGTLMLLGVLVLIGWLLDWEAERVVRQGFPRDSAGVVKAMATRQHIQHHDSAIILLHGLFNSPEIFQSLLVDLTNEPHDIFAPLLPFHGRELTDFQQFDHEVVVQAVAKYIQSIAQNYQKIWIMGFSYGGTVLVDLSSRGLLPNHVHLILYSPAIFLTDNDWWGNLKVYGYGLWRQYCNYPQLGCQFPAYGSGDEMARDYLDKETRFRYQVVTPVKAIFRVDKVARVLWQQMDRPIHLWLAKDDNRVDSEALQQACFSHPDCRYRQFPSGKHLIHLGAQGKQFRQYLLELVSQ